MKALDERIILYEERCPRFNGSRGYIETMKVEKQKSRFDGAGV